MRIFSSPIIRTNTILMLVGISLLSMSCVQDASERLSTEKQDFVLTMTDIEVINLGFPATLNIKKGSQQEVRINAQPEVFEAMTKIVNNKEWLIDLENFSGGYESVTIELTLPSFSGLLTSSTGDIIVEDYFQNIDVLNLEVQSTGKINFKGTARQIDVLIDGTGNVTLDGLATQLNSSLDSTGDLMAYGLEAAIVDVLSTSTGDAEIVAQEELSVIMTGIGDVKYKGNPSITSNISGIGELMDEN